MPKFVQPSLWDAADQPVNQRVNQPVNQPAPAEASALSVTPQVQAVLSPAAKAFNLQLKRIDTLKDQLQRLEALGHSHRAALHTQVAPLKKQQAQYMREMALWLDTCLAQKSLSGAHRQTARDIVCSMAMALAQDGDTEMAELHDRHSPRTLEQLAQDSQKDLRVQLEEALGGTLDGLQEDASVDELLQAGMERLRQNVQDEQERRREAAQAKKSRKKPAAARSKAQLLQEDAETMLRQIFRQLASALHPDREPDAQERLRKTALMSEANAAYGRKDLVALMQIQQRAALADADAASRMTDEKLAALTLLLKQQVAELERERTLKDQQLSAEFELPFGRGVTPKTLQMALVEEVMLLEEELELMQHDLECAKDSARLKRWLTEQRRMAKQIDGMAKQIDGMDFW